MQVRNLIAHAGDIADETVPPTRGLNYVNDAIARINAEAKANFPFMTEADLDSELPFPETWQRTMVVPFVAGRIKTKDSSQFEYSDLYAEFATALESFIARYQIPEEYRDRSGQTYDPLTGEWYTATSDIYVMPPFPWGGRW